MPPKKTNDKLPSIYASKLGAGNPLPVKKKRELTAVEKNVLATMKKGGEPDVKINKMKTFLKGNCGCLADAKKHADKKKK